LELYTMNNHHLLKYNKLNRYDSISHK
jgi:hypothetical protein